MSKSRLRRQIAAEESSDIVIYPNRRTLVTWILLYGIPSLIGGLFALGLLLLMIVTPEMLDQIGAVLMLILLMGGLGALGAWPMFRLIKFARSGEPILVINHAGISARRVYASAAIFLPWEEVKAVRGGSGTSYTLFSVQPVNDKMLFARLSPMARLAHHLNMLSRTFAFSQDVLDQPIEALLEQIQKHYKKELQLHKEYQPTEEKFLSKMGEREIVLYTSRWHLLAAAFFLVMALVPGLILIFIGHWQLSGILISLLFLVGGTVAGSTLAWNILHVPVLVVDGEGIASPRFLKHAKIKWEEIDAVYCGIGEMDLVIDASPSGIIPFLARQNKGRLVIPRDMDISIPQMVFTIPQRMLPLPLDRLLEQINVRFQDRLEYHKIATDIDEQ